LENYRLLQERQPEIGGALSCQLMLAFLFVLFNWLHFLGVTADYFYSNSRLGWTSQTPNIQISAANWAPFCGPTDSINTLAGSILAYFSVIFFVNNTENSKERRKDSAGWWKQLTP